MGDRSRRFPPPWTIEDNGACFIVRDHNGQTLTYVVRRAAFRAAPTICSATGSRLAAPRPMAYLGHRNIQTTTRYTELAPGRFKGFWRD